MSLTSKLDVSEVRNFAGCSPCSGLKRFESLIVDIDGDVDEQHGDRHCDTPMIRIPK